MGGNRVNMDQNVKGTFRAHHGNRATGVRDTRAELKCKRLKDDIILNIMARSVYLYLAGRDRKPKEANGVLYTNYTARPCS